MYNAGTSMTSGDKSDDPQMTPEFQRLFEQAYDQLRAMAQKQMASERPGHTLQPTALVHEAYLRLVGDKAGGQWDHRGHFFAAAAEAMRRILVDHARKRQYAKRGGGAQRISLEETMIVSPERGANLIALDEALDKLAAIDPRKSKVVELRFFGGLTIDETAEALHISDVTVMRDWNMAKAWLYNSLSNET
jgi:RNA polymerase sigma factor (TIGR02999 family)